MYTLQFIPQIDQQQILNSTALFGFPLHHRLWSRSSHEWRCYFSFRVGCKPTREAILIMELNSNALLGKLKLCIWRDCSRWMDTLMLSFSLRYPLWRKIEWEREREKERERERERERKKIYIYIDISIFFYSFFVFYFIQWKMNYISKKDNRIYINKQMKGWKLS